jgi:hypothetical protein
MIWLALPCPSSVFEQRDQDAYKASCRFVILSASRQCCQVGSGPVGIPFALRVADGSIKAGVESVIVGSFN